MEQPWTEGLSFLTMDVTSLYSNIDHEIGICCVKKFLDKDQGLPELQIQFIRDAVRFILEDNYFTYNNKIYQQCKGTAMAPSYANLFMGAFEEELIWGNTEFKPQIIIYRRFIDDLSFLWKGDEDSTLRFAEKFNNYWVLESTQWD